MVLDAMQHEKERISVTEPIIIISPPVLEELTGAPLAQPLPDTSTLKKRSKAQAEHGDIDGNERETRVMKNRESAARSRAKKMEHTTILETQVQQLRQQNQLLRSQILEVAAAATTETRNNNENQTM